MEVDGVEIWMRSAEHSSPPVSAENSISETGASNPGIENFGFVFMCY
jgi:hypothetical protein